jgi:aminoglycoside phosphotransferase (APT) family kinase protein
VPGVEIGAVVPLGEGTDNIAYEVDGGLIVHFSKEPDPERRADLITGETALLAVVTEFSPLPVPIPLSADPARGCWSYRKLPGEPLLAQPQAQRQAWTPTIAAELGVLLAALHAAPIERMARFVDRDETPLTEWQDEAADHYDEVVEQVPVDRRAAIGEFLYAPPPPEADALVLSHNDLGIEHVLVNRPSAPLA